MTLVVLSSVLIQVVSITMIPLLRKFRERANTGHPYVPFGISDQHSVTTVSTAHASSNVIPQSIHPAQTTSHGPNPAVLPNAHPPLHPYGPMNITEQNPPYPGQYCYSGKEAQPRADLLDFAAAPIAPLPQ